MMRSFALLTLQGLIKKQKIENGAFEKFGKYSGR